MPLSQLISPSTMKNAITAIRTKYAFALLFSALLFSFAPPTQLMPTSLRVTVLNESGNSEKGAVVTLYKTQQDYEKEQNPALPAQTTNDKGVAVFRDLQPVIYHVSAVKGDRDNANGATQTDTLKASRQNKVNIIIE